MKKCPNCQKEFPDSMRFCQTDGTPLLDTVVEEVQPEDLLKTTVVRQEDIASSIPSSDPFKTMVAGSGKTEDSGDLLQLPEEFDPLKTMVATPISAPEKPVFEEPQPEPPKFEAFKEEIQDAQPASPFNGFSQPSEPLPEPTPDYTNDQTALQPESPKFSKPDLSPPNFGNLSAKENLEEDLAATMIQNSWDAGKASLSDSASVSNDSPFSKPNDAPMSSPFETPPVKEPQSPFGQTPQSPFEAPKSPFDEPYSQPQQSSFESPKSPFDPPQSSFQEPPPTQFGTPLPQFGTPQSKFDQMNDQSFGNQPLQQNDWTPPPSPVSGWQDQGLGAQTPFQPPMAMQGQNQTLPIISLVLGIISLCCYIGWATGPAALITGYLGMKNCNNDPNQYGGKGLAIAGMIVGGIFMAIWLIYWIIIIVVYGSLIGFSVFGR